MKSYRSRNQRQQLHWHKIISSFILFTIVLCAISFTETKCSHFHKEFAQRYEENDNWAYLHGPGEAVEQNFEYENPKARPPGFHGVDKINPTDETDDHSKETDILEDSPETNEEYDGNSDEYENKDTFSDPFFEPTVQPAQSLQQDVDEGIQTTGSNQEQFEKGALEDHVSKTSVFSTHAKSPEGHSVPCWQNPDMINENGEKICAKGHSGSYPSWARAGFGKIGSRGPKGEPGIQGLPGLSIEGVKGQKGEPCLFDYAAWAAKNEKPTQTASKTSKKPENLISEGPTKRGDYEIVPGSIVFRNRASLVHMTEFSRIGTIIFIKDEEKYFGRVADGWREIMMGGDVIFLPNSKALNDASTNKPKESDAVNRNRRTSNNKKNKKIKPHLRMIALNDPWNGDLHGVHGADHKCSSEAKNAKIEGTFRAFLSHGTNSMKELVNSADRNSPVFNLQGQLLFKSWNSIFENSGIFSSGAVILSFNGNNVLTDSHWPMKRIWHGLKSSDVSVSMGKSPNCKSWNSDRFYNHGLASDLLLEGNLLLSQQKFDCRQNLIVLCIETARSHNKSAE